MSSVLLSSVPLSLAKIQCNINDRRNEDTPISVKQKRGEPVAALKVGIGLETGSTNKQVLQHSVWNVRKENYTTEDKIFTVACR